MSEEKGKGVKETIADEGKVLVKEVYSDVGKPVLKPVGSLAGGLVNLVLWPVKLAIDTANTKLEQLSERVARKVAKKVPPERQLPPPATIAAPAALQYALLGDGDEVAELRELFENLLVASMDRETAPSVHPAFVQIIAQLTPDEAWILKSITQSEYAAIYPYKMIHGVRTLLGLDIGIDESRLRQYLANLERLGILHLDWGARGTEDKPSYAKLYALVETEFSERGETSPVMQQGAIVVTALGAQFLATCVGVHVSAAQ